MKGWAMSGELTEQEFSKHVNSTFRIKETTLDLQLVEVKPYFAKENEQAGMERFSVYFDGPAEYLPQRVYSLEHESMGAFELFLVPIAGDGKSFRYEAVFNYHKT